MASFDIERLNKFRKGKFKEINTIVETGTFKGWGTRVMAKNFKNVITIELDQQLYNTTSETLNKEGYNNVDFILGDSSKEMKKVVNQLNEAVAFFLDAHWSGNEKVNWEKSRWKGYNTNTAHTGKGDKPSSTEQLPLDEELKAISEDFLHSGIIYIDDTTKFGEDGQGLKDRSFEGEDWTHLNLYHLKNILKPRIISWTNFADQVIITIRHKPKNRLDNFFQHLQFNIFSLIFELRKLMRGLINRSKK